MRSPVRRGGRQLVPRFDDFYGAVFDPIPHGRDERLRVLDLGAGTGILSAMVAERFPRSQVTLVDLSGKMLDVARRRLAAEPQFRFRVVDYTKEFIGEEYEVVVSALSIHHLTDGDKRELFRKVHEVLAGGGVFVNADQILGATPEIEARYHRDWLAQARGADKQALLAALERMQEDKSATLEAQIAWLKSAGFEAVDCSYKDGRFAVYSGRKRGRERKDAVDG